MSLLDGKCAKPQNPTPGITTSFCVYAVGHSGNCSWADTAETRRERLKAEYAA